MKTLRTRFAEAFNSGTLFNRHTFRILAIVLFAFPDPIISDVIAIILLAVSFFLPEGWNWKRHGATSCGCHFCKDRIRRHVNPQQRTGALPLAPASSRRVCHREVFTGNACGFVPTNIRPQLSYTLDRCPATEDSKHSWRYWPKLEGILLYRLSGYGSKVAIKCGSRELAGTGRPAR
ncbi:MAG: hypothetical protein PHQ43_00485 [Dehalococcoidales bacterium]|nr:hypothetical protein [Dehalococcoidales bacterium]